MLSPGPSPEKPKRGTGEIILLFVVWLFGGLLALVGLVYLGCSGVCS